MRRHVTAEILNYHTWGTILLRRALTFLFGEESYHRYQQILEELPRILLAHELHLTDKALGGLALDLTISIERARQGFSPDIATMLDPQQQDAVLVNALCALGSAELLSSEPEMMSVGECIKAKRGLNPEPRLGAHGHLSDAP